MAAIIVAFSRRVITQSRFAAGGRSDILRQKVTVRRFLVWVISTALRPKALRVAENLCLRQYWCCSAGTRSRACAMRTKPETLLRWLRRVGVPIGPGAGGLVDGRFPRTSRSSSIEIRIPNRSPRVNGIAERWVKSARTECLDHLFIFSEAGPWRDLSTYVSYFNHWRPHRSIGQRAPRDAEEPRSPSQQKYERSSQTL
jgi:hypothetical protein